MCVYNTLFLSLKIATTGAFSNSHFVKLEILEYSNYIYSHLGHILQ